MTGFVAVLVGSDSDLAVMQRTADVLKGYAIPYELRIASAHRTPDATQAYVRDAEARGCQVFICAAGLAAHLAGTVAAQTTRPVIGVPLEGGALGGVDALFSTVQMPGGVPVACVAIGRHGAGNAGHLAAQMLALADPLLAERVRAERRAQTAAVLAKDQTLRGS
ncbi:MAG: 5-(carboxyamino)imidazole ribonucleotide mutase [Acidiferrobacteraceae bacterium]